MGRYREEYLEAFLATLVGMKGKVQCMTVRASQSCGNRYDGHTMNLTPLLSPLMQTKPGCSPICIFLTECLCQRGAVALDQ